MTVKKPSDEKSSTTRGPAYDTEFLEKAPSISSGLNLAVQGYLALAVGTFLVLFSLGYFMFFKVAIGVLGLALIAWGTYVSGVISTVSHWLGKLGKRS